MGFNEFLGNPGIVATLRSMLEGERVPSAMLFAGRRGLGKYTLAVMFAQAANCERLRDDFCGECATCRRIALLRNPAPLVERGLLERGENVDSAFVERTPLILTTHPDVWSIVPDPMRSKTPVARPVIHVGQLRAVQRAVYFRPTARRRIFILDGAETMRWDLANIFLKILEEPPTTATLILLAPNPYQLLPTIVSRCLQFHFAPLSQPQIEAALAERTKLAPASRTAAAQLAEGSLGAALALDVNRELELRRSALRLLELGMSGRVTELFAQSADLAKAREVSFERVLEVLSSLLDDLLQLTSLAGVRPRGLVLRNVALRQELEALALKIDIRWVQQAVGGVDKLDARWRRNINRQLALDALAVSLGRP